MGVGSKGGGGDGRDGESAGDWRAEEVVAGNREALDALRELVTYPFLYVRQSCLLGLKWPRGLLLYGPPGTGKTSLVQAVVRECNAHLTMIKYQLNFKTVIPRTVRGVLLHGPPGTGPGNSNGNVTVGERLLSTLLTEMDGLELAMGIIVLAASNHPNAIDAALLRPERFDMVLYVPLPDAQGRHEIPRIHTRKLKLGEDVDLGKIAECTELFTGADLEGLQGSRNDGTKGRSVSKFDTWPSFPGGHH